MKVKTWYKNRNLYSSGAQIDGYVFIKEKKKHKYLTYSINLHHNSPFLYLNSSWREREIISFVQASERELEKIYTLIFDCIFNERFKK